MPPDDHKTSYSPGDLYDLLSTSTEARFHAGYMFHRYCLNSISTSSSHTHGGATSARMKDDDTLETEVWDIALACMALSVKVRVPFH